MNKEGRLFTDVDNKKYSLLRIKGILKYEVKFEEFKFYPIDKEPHNWGELWSERLDYYEVPSGDKGKFIVVVYGKHYYRANNRLTLTICLNDINGITNLHAVGINEMGKPSREDRCNVIEKFIYSPRRILGEYIK